MSGEQPIPLHRGETRVDELARELAHSRVAIETLRAEVTGLEEQLQIVEGRTLRHEAGQDLARELKGELADVEERLESEATLRRDLGAVVGRTGTRDREFESELRRALEAIADRLDDFESHQRATEERQRTLIAEAAEWVGGEQRIEERFVALERQVAAQHEASIDNVEQLASAAARLPDLDRRLDELASESVAARTARQRMDAEIAALRSVRDRETEMLDLLEQHRSTRTRHEHRLSEIEEFLATVVRASAGAADERGRLAREQAGAADRLRAFGERLEELRISIVEHQRRQVRADEQTGRRTVEETERELRVARNLLTRMSEQLEDAVLDQPL